jgi:ribonuclease BN (tRNA processing enzyme)
MNEHEFSTEWENADIKLRVPFSFPGISTSVIISSVRDQSYHLCDTGDGILKSLCLEMDFKNTSENLKSLVFTHDHFDHIGGLLSILGFLRMKGRRTCLKLIYPAGSRLIEDVLDAFCRRFESLSFRIDRVRMQDNKSILVDDWVITGYDTMHWGSITVDNATSIVDDGTDAKVIVFEHAQSKVGVSGDTGNTDILKKIACDLDCFLLEATYPKGRNVDQEYYNKVHLNTELATQIGSLSKDFRLYHALPENWGSF